MSHLELKIPPVAVAVLAGLMMWTASAAAVAITWQFPFRQVLALAFVVVGLVVAISGVVSFAKAGTTVNPTTPQATTLLVQGGVYGFTRNPMYLGFLLALAGWGVFLANALAFAVIPLFVMYMNRFQITREERILLAKFGEEFSAYQRRVRRWL